MLTKADFQKAIADSVSAYPAIAPLYQAGDPRITQHLDAMATMMSMLSAQLEVAMMEPFQKTRASTVLADAAMRGIVPKASPARVRVRAANTGTSSFEVESGRVITDSAGLPYVVETSALVPSGGEVTFEAVQRRSVTLTHRVSNSVPFYAIEIPAANDGAYLCGVAVSDDGGEYTYCDRYTNVFDGERVFHVEADDAQRVFVRMGAQGVVGVQPLDGQDITLSVIYCMGNVVPNSGSPFAFDYVTGPAGALVELTMDAMLNPGKDPISSSMLRDLSRYPSVYNHNAVFLGEFDFLVRRDFPTLRFLSVWNESAEERARGPDVRNINTLFVACLSDDGSEDVLEQTGEPIEPAVIDDSALTGTQVAIRRAILAADDSYRVAFYTPVRSKIAMNITARVATSYVASDVRAKIIDALLAEFGEDAAASRRGGSRALYQTVYALLKAKIPALSVGGADLVVNIEETAAILARPEMWRFVSADSLSVAVERANVITQSWGG